MNEIKHFNIRVYGILKNQFDEVLVSDEFIFDTLMTKFPGGGLKFGEGPEECLIRECLEEFGQETEIIEHFYTTGFFQEAYYFKNHQLISIYYTIRLKSDPSFKISEKAFDFPAGINGSQSFRWISLQDCEPDTFTFPIDRYVVKLLKNKLK